MSATLANFVVSMPSQLFTMARSFKAVSNGKIYIGKPDTDPADPENQIQAYIEGEDGISVPVSQPVIINAGGYPVYNGQIAKFVTVENYSMAVYDAYGTQQFYFPDVMKYDPDQFEIRFRDELASNSGAGMIGTESGDTVQESLNILFRNKVFSSASQFHQVNGETDDQIINLTSFHEDQNTGGGLFQWSSSMPKSSHNGGTIIDPDKAFPETWDAAGKIAWFAAAATGSGVWLRTIDTGYLLAEWFGAKPWNVGDTHDSTQEFQQCATIAGRNGCWRWMKRHRILSYINIPNKQTFGSFAQTTSVYSELFNPLDFQGVHVLADPSLGRTVQNAVFFDAASGEAFRCNEGAVPSDCLVYGRGYTTTGMDLSVSLPPVTSYCDTQAFRHNKAINPKNVTVALMRHAFDSNPWDASKGDYYTSTENMVITYCYCISRVSSAQDIIFNTKHINMRAYVNQIGDYSLAVRNVVFVSGSIEGYTVSTTVRASTQLSFKGTYFETGAPDLTTPVFNIVGWCTLNFEECLVYMNGTAQFVSSGGAGQSAGVAGVTIKSQGNVWRLAGGAVTNPTVFNVNPVTVKQAMIGAEVLNVSTGFTLGYWAGAVPSGTYTAPINIPF